MELKQVLGNGSARERKVFPYAQGLLAGLAIAGCVGTYNPSNSDPRPAFVYPPAAAASVAQKSDKRLCGESITLLESKELLKIGTIVDTMQLLDKTMGFKVNRIDADGVELVSFSSMAELEGKSGKKSYYRIDFGKERAIGESAIRGTVTTERGPAGEAYLIYKKIVKIPCER